MGLLLRQHHHSRESGGTPDCSGLLTTLGGNLVGDPGFPQTKADGTLEYPCDITTSSSSDPTAPDQIGLSPTPDDPECRPGSLVGCIGSRIYAEDVFVGSRQDPNSPSSFTPRLADNGGTSCTHALKTSSPAIDQAWSGTPGSHWLACEAYDQAGLYGGAAVTSGHLSSG
jgi:hypothetical protein